MPEPTDSNATASVASTVDTPAVDVNTDIDDFADFGEAMAEESTADQDSSTEATKEITPPVNSDAKTDEQDPADTKKDDTDSQAKEDDQNSDTTTDDQPTKKDAATRKEVLNTEIRELVGKRNELRGEIEQLHAAKYRTESVDELVANGMDPTEARIEAANQESQLREFNTHVADLNSNLNIESVQVMSDFPVFDPESEEYDETVTARARAVYEKAAAIKRDPNTGLVTQANVLPYDIFKAFAETHQASAAASRVKGEVAGQKAAEKQLAAAEPSSSAVATTSTEDDDPFMKGFNSVK